MKSVTAMPTKEELKQLQALPLDVKVLRTQQRIREWVRHYGVNGVYISFSGGKDSTVLLHIARKMYPEIEAVFVNTGLEYPEIQRFVKMFPNIRILYPEMTFKDVLAKYGYPVISKETSHLVGTAKRSPEGKTAKAYFDGVTKGRYDQSRYKPLIGMDFRVDDRCCAIMKKKSIHRYGKMSDKVGITAQMAAESRLRETKWLKAGCNAFEADDPISNPMAFWTEQDILLYIKTRNIEICSVYGDVVYDCDEPEQERFSDVTTLKLKTTGCSRTGCMFCAFGAHLEKGETRFQRLARTHPKQYAFCIGGGAYDPSDGLWKPNEDGLGLGHVFDEINKVYGEDFLRYKPLEEVITDERTDNR
jgi:3'-phosphoadenosine 5'-phosphosulfate sulfotransferase (PAPS reductase)/FAD synthetase